MSTNEILNQQVKELTLLLMYLTSWEENPFWETGLRGKTRQLPPELAAYTYRKCWKGYDFDVLNELTDEGLVDARGKNKSATFTDEGEERALDIARKFNINIPQT
ncbi:MAG: DUF6429 family protein [Clostridia bacterium]|nr:DUF6429 family protein [Clostridia bacterium]